jgi:hypothetical protein
VELHSRLSQKKLPHLTSAEKTTMAESAVRKLSMEFDDAPKNAPLDTRVQVRIEKAGLHMTNVLQNSNSEAAALADFMKMKGELSDQKRLLKSQVAREKFLSYLSLGDALKLDVQSQQASAQSVHLPLPPFRALCYSCR